MGNGQFNRKMKKTLFLILLSCNFIQAQTQLTLDRINTIWAPGQVPRGVNQTDTWYSLANYWNLGHNLTTNFIPKYNGTSFSNSSISDDGSSLTFGELSTFSSNIFAGANGSNLFLGSQASNSVTIKGVSTQTLCIGVDDGGSTGGNKFIYAGAPSTIMRLPLIQNNSIVFNNNGSNKTTSLIFSATGSNKTATFPNATGTVAFTSPTLGGTGLSAYSTGDMIYANAPNSLATQAIGTDGQIEMVVGGIPTWTTSASGITGPGSSTANAITLFNGTTGKIIKNSNITLDGSGNMTVPNNWQLSSSDGGVISLSPTGNVEIGGDFATDIFGDFISPGNNYFGNSIFIAGGATGTVPTTLVDIRGAGQFKYLDTHQCNGCVLTTYTANAGVGVWALPTVSGGGSNTTINAGTGITINGTTPTYTVGISTSYAGQPSIITTGTLTSGGYAASPIADAYISSASTWNSKQNALTFQQGLSLTTNTVTNTLITGLSGGQTVIGGMGVSDGLTFIGSSANATSSLSGLNFLVGNNGSITAAKFLNDGTIQMGGAIATGKALDIKLRSDATLSIGSSSSKIVSLYNNGTLFLQHDQNTPNELYLYAGSTGGIRMGTTTDYAQRIIWDNSNSVGITYIPSGATLSIRGHSTAVSMVNKLQVNLLTTDDALAEVAISASTTTQKGLVIQGKASQTANLFEIQTSAGTIRTSINASGSFSAYGTQTTDNAGSGFIGELISSTVALGSAVSLITATPTNVANITLTAGDWDVSGNINYTETTATATARSGGINSSSATVPSDGTEGYNGVQSTLTTELNSIALIPKRFSMATNTPIYLVASATFSAGTCAVFGSIRARRIR